MTLTDKKNVPYRSFYPSPVPFTAQGRKAGRTRKAKLAKLIPAYLFFRANIGGIVGENAKSALALARAERYALASGWHCEWMHDNWRECGCDTEGPHRVMSCQLVDACGDLLESLGAICQPDDEYCRVVEAELALEAMPAR